MSAEYDPSILRKYAERLYRRAELAAVWFPIVGFLIGLSVLVVWVNFFAARAPAPPPAWPGWLLLIGPGIGFLYGRERAFKLRLEAQRTLCQVQIEQNTRHEG